MAPLPIDIAMLHYNAVDPAAAPLISGLVAAGKAVISGTALAQAKFALGTFVPKDRNSLWYLLRMLKNDPLFWRRAMGAGKRLRGLRSSPHAAAIAFATGRPPRRSPAACSAAPIPAMSRPMPRQGAIP